MLFLVEVDIQHVTHFSPGSAPAQVNEKRGQVLQGIVELSYVASSKGKPPDYHNSNLTLWDILIHARTTSPHLTETLLSYVHEEYRKDLLVLTEKVKIYPQSLKGASKHCLKGVNSFELTRKQRATKLRYKTDFKVSIKLVSPSIPRIHYCATPV